MAGQYNTSEHCNAMTVQREVNTAHSRPRMCKAETINDISNIRPYIALGNNFLGSVATQQVKNTAVQNKAIYSCTIGNVNCGM